MIEFDIAINSYHYSEVQWEKNVHYVTYRHHEIIFSTGRSFFGKKKQIGIIDFKIF